MACSVTCTAARFKAEPKCLENFVANELLRLLGWSETLARAVEAVEYLAKVDTYHPIDGGLGLARYGCPHCR